MAGERREADGQEKKFGNALIVIHILHKLLFTSWKSSIDTLRRLTEFP